MNRKHLIERNFYMSFFAAFLPLLIRCRNLSPAFKCYNKTLQVLSPPPPSLPALSSKSRQPTRNNRPPKATRRRIRACASEHPSLVRLFKPPFANVFPFKARFIHGGGAQSQLTRPHAAAAMAIL
jgi:hypothetical protein